MSGTTIIITLVIIIFVLLLVFWLIRTRGNTSGPHIDTSMTATGAATEAVEEIIEEIEHALTGDKPAKAKAAAAPVPDVDMVMGSSAALMASGGAVVGSMTDIGIPAAQGAPDNLRQIKGVGPKLNTLLGTLGITRFDQIAAWSDDEIAKVDAHLGTFRGRVVRDNWVEQAGLLAAGDTAGFEAKFGKLDKPANS